MNNDEIIVSVYCLAYNHAKYIRDALEGMISQKTNFKYEIIVHDDASTDGTTDIIREYEEKYPDIIKPIYQSENQYSQKKQIVREYVYPNLRGKYVAICEGDDYWTDPQKLQMQYDIMESHPECTICTHYTKKVAMPAGKERDVYPNRSYNLSEGFVEAEKKIDISLRAQFHLTSCLFRRDLYDEYMTNQPEYAKLMTVGDVAMSLYFSKKGSMYFIDREMSVYRHGTEGSWTRRILKKHDKYIQHCEEFIVALEKAKEFFEGQHTGLFDFAIKTYKVYIAIEKKDYKFVLDKENRDVIDRMGKKALLKFYILRFFPYLDDVWEFVKKYILKRV